MNKQTALNTPTIFNTSIIDKIPSDSQFHLLSNTIQLLIQKSLKWSKNGTFDNRLWTFLEN